MVQFRPKTCLGGISVFDSVTDRALKFLQAHIIDNEKECDLCVIVDHLLQHNLTLTFEGESMTLQTFVGLECELLR